MFISYIKRLFAISLFVFGFSSILLCICEYYDEIDFEYEKAMIEKFKEAAQNVKWKGSPGLAYQGQILGSHVLIDNHDEGKQELIKFINSSFGFDERFSGISQERFQSLSLALVNFSISFYKEKDTDSCRHREEKLELQVKEASQEFLCNLYLAEQACKTKIVENAESKLIPVPKN